MAFTPRVSAPASARLHLVLCLAEKHLRKSTIHPSFSWGVCFLQILICSFLSIIPI